MSSRPTTRQTSLHTAAMLGDTAKLASSLASLIQHPRNAGSVLHEATAFNQPAVVELLLKAVDAHDQVDTKDFVDPIDQQGKTPLYLAAASGLYSIAATLIRYGANVNFAVPKSKRTPLMVASLNRHVAIVQLLLKHGADVNAWDFQQRSVLMYALTSFDCSQLLINQGSDVNHTDQNGTLALMEAAYVGDKAMVRLLLHAGARLQGLDDPKKQRAAQWAIRNGLGDVIDQSRTELKRLMGGTKPQHHHALATPTKFTSR